MQQSIDEKRVSKPINYEHINIRCNQGMISGGGAYNFPIRQAQQKISENRVRLQVLIRQSPMYKTAKTIGLVIQKHHTISTDETMKLNPYL